MTISASFNGLSGSYSKTLNDISDLIATDNYFIVGDGTTWASETPAQARVSLDVYSQAESEALGGANISTLDDIDAGTTNKHLTATLKTKLDAIETGATADQTSTQIKTAYESNSDTNALTDSLKTNYNTAYTHSQAAHAPSGAEVNVQSDWNASSGDANILNKPTIPSGNQIIDWTGSSAGAIHKTNLPAIALTTVQTAANQSAQLALTTEEGDAVVRTDEKKTYIKNNGTAGNMADFTLLESPTDVVTSVNSQVGAVSITTVDSANTATTLAVARTIAGVSFDGSGNISLNNNGITNGAGYITSANGGNAATVDGIDSTQFLRSDADDSFNGTITAISDGTNPVIIIDGTPPNYGPAIIRFLDAGSSVKAIDLVYRKFANTLGFEKSTDGTTLWTTDCDTGITNFDFQPTFSGDSILTTESNLNATNISSGTIDTARLPSTIITNTIKASSSSGLSLLDDGDNEGVFVEDGGQVGIGKNSAGFPLDVNGVVAVRGNADSYNSEQPTLRFMRYNRFYGTSDQHHYIASKVYNDAANSQLIFYINDGTTTNGTSHAKTLTLDGSGNVTVLGTVDGRNIATDGTKLDGIETLSDVTDATNVSAAGALMKNGGTMSGVFSIQHGNQDHFQIKDKEIGLNIYGTQSVTSIKFMSIKNNEPLSAGETGANYHRIYYDTSSLHRFSLNRTAAGNSENYDKHTALDLIKGQDTGADGIRANFPNGRVGIKTASPSVELEVVGDVVVSGSISKGSGAFDIPHPDPAKKETHRLRHYFVETPSAGGCIYKYQLYCNGGDNYIDLPDYFKYLNKDCLVWVNPFSHFGRGCGEVIEGGNRAKIVVDQDGLYNILIFGDRKDELAMENFDKFGVEYEVKEEEILEEFEIEN